MKIEKNQQHGDLKCYAFVSKFLWVHWHTGRIEDYKNRWFRLRSISLILFGTVYDIEIPFLKFYKR